MSGAADAAWRAAEPAPSPATTVWRVDLAVGPEAVRACLAALPEDERARALRFVREEDRARFAVSHAALRGILAGTLGEDPRHLRFRTGAAGKPELDGPSGDRLHFNLSHSGRVALVGLSRAGRIGVDVEILRPIADALGLARAHFAPAETAALARLPEAARRDAFYRCWTCKEAFVKALGLGLSFPLDRFAVAIEPAPAALLAIDGDGRAADAWSLHALSPAPGHAGAVVVEGAGEPCTLRSLSPDWVATVT